MSERVRYSRNDLFGIRSAMESPSHQHHHHHRDGSQKTEAGPNAGGDLAWRRGSDRDEKFRGLRRADMSGSNLEELREKGHPAINDSGPVAEPLWVYRTAGSSAVSAPTPWGEIQTLIDEELVERDKMEVCRAGDSEYLPYVVALAMRNSRLAPQPVSFDDMEGLICSPKKPSEASTPTWGRRSIDDLHDHHQLHDRQNSNHSGNNNNNNNNSHTPSALGGSNSHHLEVLHDSAPVESTSSTRGSGAGPRPMMPPMAILPPDPLLPSPTTKNPPTAFPAPPAPAVAEPEPAPAVVHTPAPIAPPPVAPAAASTPNLSPQANSSTTKKQAKEKQQQAKDKESHQATKAEAHAAKQTAQPAPAVVAQPPPKPSPPAWGGKGVAPKGDAVDLEALLAEERRQDQERAKAEAEKALADAAKEKGAASTQGGNKKLSKSELEAQRMLDTKFPSLDSLSMETPPSRKKGK